MRRGQAGRSHRLGGQLLRQPRRQLAIDKQLDCDGACESASESDRATLEALRGKRRSRTRSSPIVCSLHRFSGARWDALSSHGARVQRPLWASTSTKNPAYRDVIYVEALIGPDTVNTLPPATLEAFRDHGEVARTVDRRCGRRTNARSPHSRRTGSACDDVTAQLLADGLRRSRVVRNIARWLDGKRRLRIAASPGAASASHE